MVTGAEAHFWGHDEFMGYAGDRGMEDRADGAEMADLDRLETFLPFFVPVPFFEGCCGIGQRYLGGGGGAGKGRKLQQQCLQCGGVE